MAFVTVARLSDLPPGKARCVVVDGATVALYRVANRFYATQDTCCGRGGQLSAGTVNTETRTVSCPLHSWEYDLASGQFAEAPFVRLRTYPVRVAGDEIQVDIDASG